MSLPIFFVNVSKVVITLVKVTFSSFKYCFELVKRIFHLKVLVFLAILNTGRLLELNTHLDRIWYNFPVDLKNYIMLYLCV